MTKYDEQLSRMLSLMEDKNANKKPASNIEYHANGADGKVYGILKEGTKYYIKTTENGKENISESYEYINGFINRRENEFKSYNEATKQLELKLMSLNEAYGKHEEVSTVDFKRGEKTLNYLTEEARKELNRMNQIFENSCKIGCCEDPESKGKSTAENTTKNNAPFSEKANATLDKDPKFKGTVQGATENKEVKNVESELTSDKKKTKNTSSKKDYKKAHSDLDGENIAEKKPSGAKSVKMNESAAAFDNQYNDNNYNFGDEEEYDYDNSYDDNENYGWENGDDYDNSYDDNENYDWGNGDDYDEEYDDYDEEYDDNDLVGQGEDNEYEDDLDSILEEFEKSYGKPSVDHSKQDIISGEDDVMKNYCSKKGTDSKSAKWERVNEENGNVNKPTKQGNEETMKSFQKKGNLPVQSWDKMDKKKMNEAINSIVSDVYKKLTENKSSNKKQKETLKEAVDRIVKEEVTKLDAWGKHPRYQQPAFETPDNNEVLAGSAEKDWNDDSAKGKEPYGRKIGNGKPFDKLVNTLTDKVMAQLKENVNEIGGMRNLKNFYDFGKNGDLESYDFDEKAYIKNGEGTNRNEFDNCTSKLKKPKKSDEYSSFNMDTERDKDITRIKRASARPGLLGKLDRTAMVGAGKLGKGAKKVNDFLNNKVGTTHKFGK